MSMMYVRNLVDLHLKYYTDAHDVDEFVATIGNFGGHFNVGEVSVVGMLMRYLDSSPTDVIDYVASNAKI